ncbi:hypothetical protein HMPREF0023_1544 [Acinetobacter sp. ATCC 27244]|nr:hypothetical protein HMPREF0023_1544 [Acinetobacter sp. ATCC 27244]
MSSIGFLNFRFNNGFFNHLKADQIGKCFNLLYNCNHFMA